MSVPSEKTVLKFNANNFIGQVQDGEKRAFDLSKPFGLAPPTPISVTSSNAAGGLSTPKLSTPKIVGGSLQTHVAFPKLSVKGLTPVSMPAVTGSAPVPTQAAIQAPTFKQIQPPSLKLTQPVLRTKIPAGGLLKMSKGPAVAQPIVVEKGEDYDVVQVDPAADPTPVLGDDHMDDDIIKHEHEEPLEMVAPQAAN